MRHPSRLLLLVPLASALAACAAMVNWEITPYSDKRVNPISPDRVQVYATQPPFDFEPIGELTLEPCNACGEDAIRERARNVAAKWGCDVVIFVSETTRLTGVVPLGNGASAVHARTRTAVIGRKRSE